MKKDTYIWSAVLLFIFYLFISGIPLVVYNAASTIISMVGGALAGIAIYYLIKSLKKNDEFSMFASLAPGFAAIIIGIIFVYNFLQKETRLLKNEGVITTAIITDGSSMESRRGGVYTIQVAFKNEKGVKLSKKTTIGENSYKKIGIGQEISIIYYPKNPAILTAILTEEDISNYIYSKSLKIDIKAIEKVHSMKHDEISSYLDPTSSLWSYTGDSDYGKGWENPTAGEIIYKNGDQIIYVKRNLSGIYKWKSDLRSNGFKQLKKEVTPTDNGDTFSVVTNTSYEKENAQVLIREVLENDLQTMILSYTTN
ncbi:hypothetical protein RQM59_11810 [Flavobacteriaceae bacterium S356]|uniref:DUF3592 domain-containing protein n=1 Tax=Asprobacillus argus TaxID=3076534 RepID=A0ABU3LHL0_9FLAO|nr:hypothetical protein [Flavobacteriaceae bacterium S356]